jgi:hypothetical protein
VKFVSEFFQRLARDQSNAAPLGDDAFFARHGAVEQIKRVVPGIVN